MKLQLIYTNEILGLASGITVQIVHQGLAVKGTTQDGPVFIVLSTSAVESLIDYIMSKQGVE